MQKVCHQIVPLFSQEETRPASRSPNTLCSPLQIMCGIVAIFGSTEQPQTLRKKIVAMVSKDDQTFISAASSSFGSL